MDAEFPSGELPAIHDALHIARDDGSALIVEVQEHINPFTVRGIAMSSTSGLRRGLGVVATGGPIRVPVGPTTLGRMFNVLGRPIDRLGEDPRIRHQSDYDRITFWIRSPAQNDVKQLREAWRRCREADVENRLQTV